MQQIGPPPALFVDRNIDSFPPNVDRVVRYEFTFVGRAAQRHAQELLKSSPVADRNLPFDHFLPANCVQRKALRNPDSNLVATAANVKDSDSQRFHLYSDLVEQILHLGRQRPCLQVFAKAVLYFLPHFIQVLL